MEMLSLVIGPLSLVLSAASDLSVVKEVVEISEKAGDQSGLLYATGVACVVMKSIIILFWRKWEKARTDLKQASLQRETLIQNHADRISNLRDKHDMEIREMNREMNRTSEKLSEIMAKLNATR